MNHDQAHSLRSIEFKSERKLSVNSGGVSRVMSFSSGKGGVGKTCMVLNVGLGLCNLGKRVLILDADLGLANVDVMLGIRPAYTLLDVLDGRKTLEDIIIGGPFGISIIPAASGVESICNLDSARRMVLLDAVDSIAHDFDYILIDTPAGIGPDVMYFNSSAAEIVCIINSEPTSITDSYALIKVLARNYGEKKFSVVANGVADEKEGLHSFRILQKAVERFLHVHLEYMGHVPTDSAVGEAIKSQRAILEMFPSSRAALSFSALAKKINAGFLELRVKGGMQFLFRRLLAAQGARDGES